MCLFSIIVPIYNTTETYLRACIESTLRQGTDALEVLLIDDGSASPVGEICAEYVKRDGPVRYIRQENQGVSVARNRGLDEAKGEYIVFLDADDWLSDDFLARVSAKIPDSRPDVVLYGYCSDYANKFLKRSLDLKAAAPDPQRMEQAVLGLESCFLPYDVSTIWGKLIRRGMLEENAIRFPVGIRKGQDTVFMLHVYRYCGTCAYADETGYHYRKNSASVTHKLNPQIVEIDEMLLEQYGKFLKQSGREAEAEEILNVKCFHFLTGEFMELYFLHPDNPKTKRELQEEYARLTEREPYRSAIENAGVTGFYHKMKQKALRKKKIRLLWFLKEAEGFAQRLLVSEFRS